MEKLNARIVLSILLAVSLAACGFDFDRALPDDVDPDAFTDEPDAGTEPEPDAEMPIPEGVDPVTGEEIVDVVPPAPSPAEPLPLDACDDRTYLDVEWVTSESSHFTFHFPPDTPADRDVGEIASVREDAYAAISEQLGFEEDIVIDVWMSPTRVAARANGLGLGRAWPSSNRYEVVYTGVDGSYERDRYGHELTHVIAHHAIPTEGDHHPFLQEGLAEYLDQSGRDMHQSFASALRSETETRVRLTELEDYDAWGSNYGRAGSFMQHLVESSGMEAAIALIEATAVTWSRGCYTHPEVGCVEDAASVAALLDHGLRVATGQTFEAFSDGWTAAVRAALAEPDVRVRRADRRAIHALVREMDQAVTDDDADRYRRTMDGFYCDWADEAERVRIAERAVWAWGATTTQVVAIHPSGVRNFPQAAVLVSRTDEGGYVQQMQLTVEKVGLGWRVTWGSDWY